MTTDPFTTPAEAEREARVKEAHDLLARAASVKDLSTYNYDTGRRSYKGGVEAMRDALVGQGHALLAVREELADIAGSLRTLAALPTAMQRVGDSVTAAAETLDLDLSEVASAGRDIAQAIDDQAETRRSWWRRLWSCRQQVGSAEVSQ